MLIRGALPTYLPSFLPLGRYDCIEDMDVQVSMLAPFGLAKALPLGDVRPRWATMMQTWWDLDCDRDLLLGSFLHGFGAYPKMRTDSRLCFSSKVAGFVRSSAPTEWFG